MRRLTITEAMDLHLSPVSILRNIAEGHGSDGDPAYLKTWAADYDYLYLSGPHAPNPLPALLTEMMRASRFTLYKVRHDGSDQAALGKMPTSDRRPGATSHLRGQHEMLLALIRRMVPALDGSTELDRGYLGLPAWFLSRKR
jgi:hypothetical protein